MFAALLREAGVREEVVLGSRFGFIALHGGSLERLTDVIARGAAERSGSSLYAVVQPPDLRWHVPSHRADPAAAPNLAAFIDHVDVVVSVHGFGAPGLWQSILLGGRNRALAASLATRIGAVLPEYDAVTELHRMPAPLRGLHPANPVNRARDGGVQLELPPRVRGMGPYWRDHSGPGLVAHTEALIDALAAVAAAWPAGEDAACT